MIIKAEGISKHYNFQIVFKNFNYSFEENDKYVIIGQNGSGKSTLLKILSSFVEPSFGKVNFFSNVKIPSDKVYQYINFTAPYVELIEEFSVEELLHLYKKCKRPLFNFSTKEFLQLLKIKVEENKEIIEFSSGMKQRIKLGLAFFFQSQALLLDEPSTNLDIEGKQLYKELVKKYSQGRILIFSSNDNEDYTFVKKIINIEDYKTKKSYA